MLGDSGGRRPPPRWQARFGRLAFLVVLGVTATLPWWRASTTHATTRTPVCSRAPLLAAAVACHRERSLASKAPPRRDTVDSVIFSKDRPLRLLALLESQLQHSVNAGATAVVLRATSHDARCAYEAVADMFPGVRFVWQRDAQSFQSTVESVVRSFRSPYIMSLVDELVFTRAVDFALVARAMRQHGRRGTFQLRLGLHYTDSALAQPRVVDEAAGLYCFEWTGADMRPSDFAHTTIVDAAVVPAGRLRREWAGIQYRHPGELEWGWYAHRPGYSPGCVHLFYENSSVVNNEASDRVRDDYAVTASDANARALANGTGHLLSGSRVDISQFAALLPPFSHISVVPRLVPLLPPGCRAPH